MEVTTLKWDLFVVVKEVKQLILRVLQTGTIGWGQTYRQNYLKKTSRQVTIDVLTKHLLPRRKVRFNY
jgi:hypothetical protein